MGFGMFTKFEFSLVSCELLMVSCPNDEPDEKREGGKDIKAGRRCSRHCCDKKFLLRSALLSYS